MNNFFGVGLFVLGAAAIVIFGLPNIFSQAGIAAPVVFIGGVAAFFSARFADSKSLGYFSVANGLRIGLFLLSVIVAIVGLSNIFTEGRAAASFYLFFVGLIGAFFSARAALT